ncbi:RNA polymerase sigma factor [Flexivirga alba]|uniref:RNA polymerase sigma factor n=1 Tax=Flexivirga alba TaxID=702742 RepID=A0ABW2AHH2_9MICO
MRGRDHKDEQLEEFIAARTQDLHHDAYQFTAAQQPAEELVIAVLAAMRRERIDMAQAGTEARLRMARASARDNTPTQDSDASQLAARFQPLARLSPRARAALVLQVVDGYDDRETARALQLTSRTTTEALESVPYDELPGTTPHSGELRSLLEDFGDLATSPSASTTLADVRAAPPPPRRPWWTYVAALLVIALTVGTVVISQRTHDDWLRTPDGLNHAHGTHFPAYTQGYKLVAIRDQAPGAAEDYGLGSQDAVVIGCAKKQSDQTSIGRLSSELIGDFDVSCSAPDGRQHLTPVMGQTVLAIDDFSRKQWPVAVYQHRSWDEYPVARKDFTVEHDKTLTDLRPTDNGGNQVRPVVPGAVLTLHGTADHPNGTFTGSLSVPSARDHTTPMFTALLSPTTTGQFQLLAGSQSPLTNCGSRDQVFYSGRQDYKTCSLVDRQVPQVDYRGWGDWGGFPESGKTMTVRFTVKHALGPWTLRLVYDSYRTTENGEFFTP